MAAEEREGTLKMKILELEESHQATIDAVVEASRSGGNDWSSDWLRSTDLMSGDSVQKFQRTEVSREFRNACGVGMIASPISKVASFFQPSRNYLGVTVQLSEAMNEQGLWYVYVRLMSWPSGVAPGDYTFTLGDMTTLSTLNESCCVLCEGGFYSEDTAVFQLPLPADSFTAAYWIKWSVSLVDINHDTCNEVWGEADVIDHVGQHNGQFVPVSHHSTKQGVNFEPSLAATVGSITQLMGTQIFKIEATDFELLERTPV